MFYRHTFKVLVCDIELETKLKEITYSVFVVECTIAIKYDVFLIAFCTQMFKASFLFNMCSIGDLLTKIYASQKVFLAFYFLLRRLSMIS